MIIDNRLYDALLVSALVLLAFMLGYLIGEFDALSYSSQAIASREIARVARDRSVEEDSGKPTQEGEEGEESGGTA